MERYRPFLISALLFLAGPSYAAERCKDVEGFRHHDVDESIEYVLSLGGNQKIIADLTPDRAPFRKFTEGRVAGDVERIIVFSSSVSSHDAVAYYRPDGCLVAFIFFPEHATQIWLSVEPLGLRV